MAQTIGNKWEIQSSLGEGGQGRTFLVREQAGANPATFVLKRLKNPDRLGRFATEVAAIQKLTHPAIVKLIDYSLDSSVPYLVTEYCPGGSLSLAEPTWRADPLQALTLFEQLLEGVVHAHASGVVHRDIKPDNVFLRVPGGAPVIGDFGLAFLEANDPRQTLTEEAVGPRLYMAPELEDGRAARVTPSADIYSLGKLLYWLVTGRVFSREKHRQQTWDLKGAITDPFTGQGTPFLEHINWLLDLMIVEDPDKRRDASNILILTRQAKQLIATRAHPLTLDVRHPCVFCGRGTYKMKVDGDPTDVRNFGLAAVSGNRWRALVCDHCGHVQLFNLGTVADWR
jgi:serine/threonine protein kinase